MVIEYGEYHEYKNSRDERDQRDESGCGMFEKTPACVIDHWMLSTLYNTCMVSVPSVDQKAWYFLFLWHRCPQLPSGPNWVAWRAMVLGHVQKLISPIKIVI